MSRPASTDILRLCPCGSDRPGKSCCGPLLAGEPAPDAERLMRSRYCAYVAQDAGYLLQTWHATTRPPSVEFDPAIRWLELSVKRHRVHDFDHAEVEFVARFRVGGRGARMRELSRFVREDGRWYYLDGKVA